jgi:hypothetical protein
MSPNFGLYSDWAQEVAPQVRDALEGRRKVPPQTPFAEAWLAMSIFSVDSMVRLEDVVQTADGINHAFPSSDEIAWAFLRLRKRGWLVVQGDLYGLTSEGRRAIGIVVGEGSVLKRVERLKGWASTNPPPGDH